MKFAVPIDPRVKLKESEKRDKYLDLTRELKPPWNMWATSTSVWIGAIVIVTNLLVLGHEDLEIRGQVETIQTTA